MRTAKKSPKLKNAYLNLYWSLGNFRCDGPYGSLSIAKHCLKMDMDGGDDDYGCTIGPFKVRKFIEQ